MLASKENFLRALGGDIPEYVPRYNIFWGVRPSFYNGERVGGVGKDIYGVNWYKEGSAVDASLPEPGNFILDDIRKWRDVIKFPNFDDVNWELMAQRDLAERDPELPKGGGTYTGGFFQALNNFMGFNEGLVACFEEPEEVKALLNYLCDNFLKYVDQFCKYYEPDFVSFGDDIAHERDSFVSIPMFEDIFEPVWRRYITPYKERGYLAVHHNCGKFDNLLPYVVEMGFNGWDPAQESNDLDAIKAKYGKSFLICGGFSSRPFLPHIEISEEEVRRMVKELLDRLAPGGGYAFQGGGAMTGDPVAVQRAEWVTDEFEKRKFDYYK